MTLQTCFLILAFQIAGTSEFCPFFIEEITLKVFLINFSFNRVINE